MGSTAVWSVLSVCDLRSLWRCTFSHWVHIRSFLCHCDIWARTAHHLKHPLMSRAVESKRTRRVFTSIYISANTIPDIYGLAVSRWTFESHWPLMGSLSQPRASWTRQEANWKCRFHPLLACFPGQRKRHDKQCWAGNQPTLSSNTAAVKKKKIQCFLAVIPTTSGFCVQEAWQWLLTVVCSVLLW